MRRNRLIAAAAVAVIAIALLVWWRRGGSDAGRAGSGEASGSEQADGSGSDPWGKGPRPPIHGVAADDDPTIVSAGSPAVVEGTVRDAASKAPVAGADVAFWSKRGELTTTSGGDGHYKLDVTTGAWSARAAVGDLALSKGQLVRVDAPHLVVDLEVEKLAHVHGIVRDAITHAPVGGAEVGIDPPTKETREELEATVGRSALTSGDGSYRLAVPPGEVRLEASAAGKLGHRALAAVAPGADVTADLELHANAHVDGKVVDAKGAAAAGATVTAFVNIADIDLNHKRTLVTGADGRFAIDGAEPGTLVLEARTDDGAATDPQVIDLGKGDVHDVVLKLQPAVALRGHVKYGDGRPARDAAVRVHRMNLATLFAETRTDDSGAFEVHGPATSTYLIDATNEYGSARLLDATTDAMNELVIHVPGGIRGKVHTKAGATKDFTVAIDQIRPAGNAREVSPPPAQRYTPADGAFEWARLEPGTYDLTVRADGAAATHVRGVAVSDGAWAEIDVALAAGVGLTGRVHAGAKPVASARVDAACVGGQQITAADGSFAFADAPAGSCALTISADGFTTTQRTAKAGATPIDIELAPAGADGKSEVDGVGVMLQPYQGAARIVGVLSRSAEGTLHSGDVIVAVDGADTATLGFTEIIARIRGEAGTKVTLTIKRGATTLDIEVVRGHVSYSGFDSGVA